MRAVVLHAPKDLRVEEYALQKPERGEVRVAIKAGGICGSDLHYYNHGGTAAIRLREPMVLGHEIAGVIAEIGEEVKGMAVGTRVAVNPSRACGDCQQCQAGRQNHCVNMHFMGSAMRFPHDQGGFRQSVTIPAVQAIRLEGDTSLEEAAMAEPLAVCLHAARIAGPLLGKRILVTGAGPIGALVTILARLGGARDIVVTDLSTFPLDIAKSCGATRIINVRDEPDALAAYAAGKGHFDLCFEASGSAVALQQALPAMVPQGTVVQLGLGGEFALPINAVITREVRLLGSFRFHHEFVDAVNLLGSGMIDVRPLITAVLPFEEATAAFKLANQRDSALKVQIAF
ncbi:L-idonate 5-dehydrogenase [Rhizobium binae]|uniref:L-idonate 5-dehydrogenase n=1 Tax=Rhizobium binae TaxID=1138190 RepID=A0ABV2MTG6_9HYPH|nr:L-idonate 5-dehydrogenase [Rhizobium binae]MBX4970006.1 L-idonate 5-dehydrogenase [Rhizobium binae]MBX4994889.1 L-idonate 5-dehydrogenase [Rhizobium binae]NKL51686.1 alcohol dehydrogenase catalytic domain-containing protein [Rhizobium leguminosarum bv. viciae]QSY85410.1 L-idonate 5-dehydrogenase [Rhizobium binae]